MRSLRRRHIAAVALVLAAVAATRCDGVDLRHSRQTAEEEQGEWEGFELETKYCSTGPWFDQKSWARATISAALCWINFNPTQLFVSPQNPKPNWCCLSWQNSANLECVSPRSKYSAVLSELMPYLGSSWFYHKKLIYQSFQSC